jgi:two-component system response regulator CpxR
MIDDDVELCELMIERLSPEGFELDVVYRGDRGIEKALSGGYALILLDVLLPEINGFDVLRAIRSRSSLPVIMLTALGDDVDRIVGLELGADDYLPKPFNPRELMARIRAVLRRDRLKSGSETGSLPDYLDVGDYVIDLKKRTASCAAVPLLLTPGEFGLLVTLVRRVGEVVSREELSSSVLGRGLNPFERSIDVHISNLRKKLGRDRNGNDRIRAIRSIGYVLDV